MYWVLGTGKLISKSGFFPCLLLSAERQAHEPLVSKSLADVHFEGQDQMCTFQ
jgi:hypothetical protein